MQHARMIMMNHSPLGKRGTRRSPVDSPSSRNIMQSNGPRREAERIPRSELEANFPIKLDGPSVIVEIVTISRPSHSGIRLKKRITKSSLNDSRQFGHDAELRSERMGKRSFRNSRSSE